MSRYIDADKLTFSRVRIIHPDGTAGGWNAVVMSSVINNAPTADVVEVIHAQWIERIDPLEWCEDDVDVYYECSNCSCNNYGQSPYCPACGAKMDVAWIDGDYGFYEVQKNEERT